ncbi:MAG: T9SS type A sorting domain-containing protein [Bacteroidetes Order II. Incertae sedis bacterium]|nr:T9SS type A sorting domain-containing protein [Bacteroidetes Order II. bacterium]
MKKHLLGLVLWFSFSFAQEAPRTIGVYGGTINAIAANANDLYVSTESSNSIFHRGLRDYTFSALPGFDSSDGYGGGIRQMVATAFRKLYVLHNGKIIQYDHTTGIKNTLVYNNVQAIAGGGNKVVFLYQDSNLKLGFGSVTGTGFKPDAGSPVVVSSAISGKVSLVLDPVDETIWILREGNAPSSTLLYHSSADWAAGFGTISAIPLTTAQVGNDKYSTLGVAPDGRVFLGGDTGTPPLHFKKVAYSDDDGIHWTQVNTGVNGIAGPNITFEQVASGYAVYFGSAVSSNQGGSGTWQKFGHTSLETNPNDGPTFPDPISTQWVYLTNDAGLGRSLNRGADIVNINAGIEAIQINGFGMNERKTLAWAVSKTGVWKGSSFATSSEWWKVSYPFGDGSPYYSVAVSPDDDWGQAHVYVGNSRIYVDFESGTGGWKKVRDLPSTYSAATYVSGIAVDPNDLSRIFVSYVDPTTGYGGAEVGEYDRGTGTWTFTPLDGFPTSLDVEDIEAYSVGGVTKVLVGTAYNGATGFLKRYGWDGTKWAVEATYSNTKLGIEDIFVAGPTSDPVACGYDYDSNQMYVVSILAATYNVFATASGVPNTTCKAVTVDTATNSYYVTANNSVYVYSGGVWTTYATYPNGTQINVLYFDDLVVGTGTGLYEHRKWATQTTPELLPRKQVLANVYPNPFGNDARIQLHLAQESDVAWELYDVMGRRVQSQAKQWLPAGEQAANINASGLVNGVYLLRIVIGRMTETHKVVVAK